MKAQSKAKANFKVSMPKHSKQHTASGAAVPPEYAKNLSVVARVSSRAMRVASRGR